MRKYQIHFAGFTSPTPIQAQTWPIALQSRDIVAIAKRSSGKTLGYLIPAFMHLRRLRNNPQNGPTVLVLAPTRELATQIQDEAIKYSEGKALLSLGEMAEVLLKCSTCSYQRLSDLRSFFWSLASNNLQA